MQKLDTCITETTNEPEYIQPAPHGQFLVFTVVQNFVLDFSFDIYSLWGSKR